jgi:hypothetical protein
MAMNAVHVAGMSTGEGTERAVVWGSQSAGGRRIELVAVANMAVATAV